MIINFNYQTFIFTKWNYLKIIERTMNRTRSFNVQKIKTIMNNNKYF